MASVTTVAGQVRSICSPLTGIVESVNSQLAQDPDAVVTDPCGAGWLAEVAGGFQPAFLLASAVAGAAAVLAFRLPVRQ